MCLVWGVQDPQDCVQSTQRAHFSYQLGQIGYFDCTHCWL